MNKKAISPLIATIIYLSIFTVIVFIVGFAIGIEFESQNTRGDDELFEQMINKIGYIKESLDGCYKVKERLITELNKTLSLTNEEPKSYSFEIIRKERDDTTAECSIISKIVNLDEVKHRYKVINNQKEFDKIIDIKSIEFELEPKIDKFIYEIFECNDFSYKNQYLDAYVEVVR